MSQLQPGGLVNIIVGENEAGERPGSPLEDLQPRREP